MLCLHLGSKSAFLAAAIRRWLYRAARAHSRSPPLLQSAYLTAGRPRASLHATTAVSDEAFCRCGEGVETAVTAVTMT